MTYIPYLIDLAETIADAIHASALADLIRSAERLDIKVAVRENCAIHDHQTCLHIANHGFGTIAAARSYLHRQMETIVFSEVA